jgi:cyanophycinase
MTPRALSRAALAAVLASSGCSSSTAATTSGTGGASSASSSSSGASGTSTSGTGGGSPDKPADLVTYLTGADADADVTPKGPGLILMGGGTDVDAAFAWWKPRLAGGDVVVLRASGADGYNDYLYTQIGGADSVETMMVTSKALADSDYVAWRVAHAEGIFLAGGDQAQYVDLWKGTATAAALQAAWARGAVIGGTSAGCDVLGAFVFGAHQGSVYSDEALADPYNPYMTMDRDFLSFPPAAGTVLDTHFAQRDRMGRLLAFTARVLADGWAASAQGIGIDEATALVVDEHGHGSVVGSGSVYLLRPTLPPAVCASGKALDFEGVPYLTLKAGDTVELPAGPATGAPGTLSASAGQLTPAAPY